MHPRLAWVYMTALAEQISIDLGWRPLTDDPREHLDLSGFSIERLSQALLDVPLVSQRASPTEIESVLVSIAFQAIVPANPKNLTVDKILAFREKYPLERAKFQTNVEEFFKGSEWLFSISKPEVLAQRLKDEYQKLWGAQLSELREKLSEVGIDTIRSCFGVTAVLPAAITSAAAHYDLPLNAVAAGTAGLAMGIIPVLRDKQKAAQEAIKASPASYLYRIEQNLKPMDLWERIKKLPVRFALKV
jgi:hypothetical protein